MTSIKDKNLIQEHDIKNTEFSSVMTKKYGISGVKQKNKLIIV